MKIEIIPELRLYLMQNQLLKEFTEEVRAYRSLNPMMMWKECRTIDCFIWRESIQGYEFWRIACHKFYQEF
jgi:hypothetical protein